MPSEDKLTFASGKLDELQDELPDNAPRFVLLSYEVFLFHMTGIHDSLSILTVGRVIR